MRGRRGWIRIMEAVTAILIMASVLIVLYTNNAPEVDYSAYVYNLQIGILLDIADNALLRNDTLNANETSLSNFVNESLPQNFNFSVRICDISSTNCLLDSSVNTGAAEVYVEDRIISSNLVKYDPKIVRLFVWEKSKE